MCLWGHNEDVHLSPYEVYNKRGIANMFVRTTESQITYMPEIQ